MELTTLSQSYGFTIEKQELRDWHFNEFEIAMKGKKSQLPMIDIEGIEQHSDNVYCCKCHWSVVKLVINWHNKKISNKRLSLPWKVGQPPNIINDNKFV